MSLSNKVILSILASGVAAVFAWVAVDFTGLYAGLKNVHGQLFLAQEVVGAIFGMFVGLGLGAVNGLSAGSQAQLRRRMAWGVIYGLIGGILGMYFGQLIFGPLYREPGQSLPGSSWGPLIFLQDVLVRAIGWAVIGLIIGLAQGLPSGSAKAARHGAVGGFIGGLLGGMLFEIAPFILPRVPGDAGTTSRGIGLIVTGVFIGFFIGIVENLMKQSWIRVVRGRNEGQEYIISKSRTTIGRDELSDIGLFGDRSVAPMHAVIEDIPGGRHVLRDAGSSTGTSVNGAKITEHTLRDGETIEIGQMKLEFHEKATASKIPRRVDVSPKPAVRIPTADFICPFCGGKKDATGACACTVGDQPVSPAPGAPTLMGGPAPFSSAGNAQPRLVCTGGPYAGQLFQLSPSGTTTVGREDGRNIQLSLDTSISRRHAYIMNESGSFVVYDEGSTNGTFVNSDRVSRQAIALGDTVAFGGSSFRFEQ